jgi:hypothetical protein
MQAGKNLDFQLGSTGSPAVLVDLSNKVQTAGLDIERDLLEANRFNNSGAKSNLKGLYGGKFPVTFFYDATVYTQMLNAVLGDNTVNIQFGPEGSTSGKPKYTGAVHIHKISKPVEVNKVMVFTTDVTLDGVLSTGTYA